MADDRGVGLEVGVAAEVDPKGQECSALIEGFKPVYQLGKLVYTSFLSSWSLGTELGFVVNRLRP